MSMICKGQTLYVGDKGDVKECIVIETGLDGSMIRVEYKDKSIGLISEDQLFSTVFDSLDSAIEYTINYNPSLNCIDDGRVV